MGDLRINWQSLRELPVPEAPRKLARDKVPGKPVRKAISSRQGRWNVPPFLW